VLRSASISYDRKVVPKIPLCLVGVLATRRRAVMPHPAAVETARKKVMKYSSDCQPVSYK